MTVRWADAETSCTGSVSGGGALDPEAAALASAMGMDVSVCVVEGTVGQLVQGEDGFLYQADAVTHTFTLTSGPCSAAGTGDSSAPPARPRSATAHS